MSFRANLFNVSLVALLMCAGCKDNATEPTPSATPSILAGRILDSDYSNAIVGAQIVDEGKINANAVSDNLGNFAISFGSLSSQYSTNIRITASGYYDTLIVVSIDKGEYKKIPTVLLRRNTIQAVSSNPEANKAAQIAYLRTSATDIDIAGVGGLENSVIEYEVRDSLGNAVAKSPRYGATFTIAFFPNSFVGGGSAPHAIPSADSTDTKGRLRVSIVSGTQAGVIEVVVLVNVDSIKTVKSSPVRISVHGGFPDQNHFSLMPSRFVFPGMDKYSEVGFSVAVGDTFSNPVLEGTAVYFHSQAGIMQTGSTDFSAYTDNKGLASVHLETVNPLPNRSPFCDQTIIDYVNGGAVGRIGYEWVFAQTQARDGNYIRDSVFVVWNQGPIKFSFNGAPPTRYNILTTVVPTIILPAGGTSASNTFTVVDNNGNPLCDGTKISATVDNIQIGIYTYSFSVNGNMNTIIPIAGYARFPGDGITNFIFSVTGGGGLGVGFSTTLHITITSEVLGNIPLTLSLPVTLIDHP
jgi:hypothetical protein